MSKLITTHQELKDEIIVAMKDGDAPRRDILRQVATELKNIEVNERRDVTDEDVNAMFKRVLKQTRETHEGSEKANTNAERTALLAEQIAILESYLPQQLAGEELEALVKKIIAEGGYTTKRDMGTVMGAITAQTGGNFDKGEAARLAGSLLS